MGGSTGALSTEASSPDLRETELRLGLPGSQSPARKHLTLELLPPSAKGKRGFSELKKDGGASGDNMGTQRKEENGGKGKLEEKKPAGAAPAAKYIFLFFSSFFSKLNFFLCYYFYLLLETVCQVYDGMCWRWGCCAIIRKYSKVSCNYCSKSLFMLGS